MVEKKYKKLLNLFIICLLGLILISSVYGADELQYSNDDIDVYKRQILMMYLYGGDWKFIRDSLKAVGAPTSAKELGTVSYTHLDVYKRQGYAK